ncbi:LacI family DNA-binding transcriptional regulator [Maliponia aquimaris]|uniref:DNA-binding transcriptional repressor MalI n=1 Tax=Maliponia aquimaris TaxID=1673631 RepID=A0A238L0G1_9RHOB|nr:LacI family DNA-binding transcriptional regulator [Maliponia aquimaris]SMX48574.1 DNA-binding transcriptional repressor MalI [Maliponia aquimaris]
MAKPTYADIATRAGVGTATVERVLNGRGGVTPETAQKVVLAARALDWPGRLPERHRGLFRIEVILVRPETGFFSRLAAAFRRIGRTLDRSVQLHVSFMDEADPAALAHHIARPPVHRAGLIVAAPDVPAVRAALEQVQGQGLPVVQVMNRILHGADYVGIDNMAAGRTAGLMLARLGAVRSSVLAVCHSPLYRVHRDRLRGFSDYLADHPHPGLAFRRVVFGGDDRHRNAALVADALRDWPDLSGVYNAGGGNSGVLHALERAGRAVFFVGHELTGTTSAALQVGRAHVILDQLPETQARRAVDLMLRRLELTEDEVDNPPIRFATITRENL